MRETKRRAAQPRFGLQGLLAGVAFALALGAGDSPFAAGGGAPSGGSMPSPSRQTINPAESYREGIEALEAGDYRRAEKKFGEVLMAAPDHPQANYYMGMAKVGRGQDKSSRRYFQRAVKESPNFIDAREQLALVYVRLGDAEGAAEQLAAMKALQAQCAAGACGAAGADVDRAVAAVEAALGSGGEMTDDGVSGEDEDGDHEEETSDLGSARFAAGLLFQPQSAGVARYQTAVRLINQARYDDAIEALRVSHAIVGPHPDILNYLGYAHRKLGRFEEARAYYARALAIAPDHLGANEYLGELYLETGDLMRARRQLATLDRLCDFGCAEREDLARLIAIAESERLAER